MGHLTLSRGEPLDAPLTSQQYELHQVGGCPLCYAYMGLTGGYLRCNQTTCSRVYVLCKDTHRYIY